MKIILGFFAAVVAIAALSSFCTWRWIAGSHPVVAVDSHDWLHKELRVTSEQHKALEPIEARYAERERLLRERMRQANRELAAAIGKSKGSSPEVAAAVEKVHQHMGALQKASLEHLFEMRTVLTPEQGDQLLQLAQKGLEESP
ncbi:MAG: periplasmic heavy metal sensor [Opitutaceae bacterium]|nr:periplasmic heavy metal sensor [Opitutaceae bacterium]